MYAERDRSIVLQVEVGQRDVLLAHALDGLRSAAALVAVLDLQIDELDAEVGRLRGAARVQADAIASLKRQLSAAIQVQVPAPRRPDLPTLEQIVGRAVMLRRLAEGAIASCPWCGELDGLYLFTASQLWTCVGCGAVGDVAAFVGRYAPDRRAAG
jgi:hypothetical protein